MATEDFSLKRFFHIAHVGSIVIGFLIGSFAGPAANAEERILRGLCGGMLGFMLSGGFYLFLITKDLQKLEIPDEELNESEFALVKNAGSMVHYKSGRPLRFWEAVGGKLFLTNQVLEFRAHRGQP
jgi:hypothetical protein